MNKNILKQDYVECYVAYIDILGYKNKIIESKNNLSIRENILNLVKEFSTLMPVRKKCNKVDYYTQTHQFSDCIVIFVPIKTHNLEDIFCKIKYLFDKSLNYGFLIRGAVDIDLMYWNGIWGSEGARKIQEDFSNNENEYVRLCLGPGIVSVYEMEKEYAKFPRIIVSEKIEKEAKKTRLKYIYKADRTIKTLDYFIDKMDTTSINKSNTKDKDYPYIRLWDPNMIFISKNIQKRFEKEKKEYISFLKDKIENFKKEIKELKREKYYYKLKEAKNIIEKYEWIIDKFEEVIEKQ
ncbi:MAG: hypothetical protein LDL53_13155 [Candidatus Hydrogenedens sp.]|nr:hypothetical protein [Candidatus Hydrogenedens sp.]